MTRSEIMSAGQANVPQRKLISGQTVQGPNTANNPNEVIGMIDSYQVHGQKKSNRGGSRGVTPTNQ